MKKVLFAAIVSFVMTSCAGIGPLGVIYTGVTAPSSVTSNPVGTKVGSAKSINVLGLVAAGDGGINAAAKNGGIKKISHVDIKTFNILGIFGSTEAFVYGE